MLGAIGLAAAALRAGLRLRRARLARSPRTARQRSRHLRLGKLAVAAALLGFLAGPLSIVTLRARAPFETAHALLGVLAAAGFAATYLLGRRLEHGRASHTLHGALGVASVLLAAAAAVAGFVLLP
jgi:hypothetical protein